ncbi:MAG: MOSC domain-containing protein [Chloroflexia bacterium]
MRRTPLTEGEITLRGFAHDREPMLIDNATGTFLTQREFPRMALVRPHLANGALRVEASGMEPLTVPIVAEGPERSVLIWRDTCPAVDQGDELAGWFGAFLGTDCRVVRLPDAYRRQVDQTFAPSADDQVGFADGFPFLLISEESLADLNSRLDAPLLMNRFRPNIVVRGGGPFWEDRVGTFRIGEITFRCVKPCARCPITTTEQETAIVGKEPLRTLATFRRGGIHVPGPVRGAAYFGQNVTHDATGVIRVGESIEL